MTHQYSAGQKVFPLFVVYRGNLYDQQAFFKKKKILYTFFNADHLDMEETLNAETSSSNFC